MRIPLDRSISGEMAPAESHLHDEGDGNDSQAVVKRPRRLLNAGEHVRARNGKSESRRFAAALSSRTGNSMSSIQGRGGPRVEIPLATSIGGEPEAVYHYSEPSYSPHCYRGFALLSLA